MGASVSKSGRVAVYEVGVRGRELLLSELLSINEDSYQEDFF